MAQYNPERQKKIAEIFDWAHAVDSVKIAKKLNDARPLYKNALKVCIQLNIDKEASKSGIELKDIENIFFEIRGFENLEIKGLMVIPRPRDSIQEQQNVFKEVKEIFDSLNQKGMNMDTLSMGMSSDYGIAIKEGSTMIRIGTGIFGQRK